MTIESILVKNKVFETEDTNKTFNLMLSRDGYIQIQQNIVQAMQEYALLKCKELLEIVADNAYAQVEHDCAIIDKNSIIRKIVQFKRFSGKNTNGTNNINSFIFC